MRILLDSNIILDVALKREPFYKEAKEIIEAIDDKKFSFYVSSVSITDIHYILSKASSRSYSLSFLNDLCETMGICITDKTAILNSLNSNFKDFEDAVQYFSALEAGINIILTRNEKDFKQAKRITILNPASFVKIYLKDSK